MRLSLFTLNIGGDAGGTSEIWKGGFNRLKFEDVVESFYLKKKDLCFLTLVSMEMKPFLYC